MATRRPVGSHRVRLRDSAGGGAAAERRRSGDTPDASKVACTHSARRTSRGKAKPACASSMQRSSIDRQARSRRRSTSARAVSAATATPERINFSFGVQAFTDTFLYANARLQRDGRNDILNLPLTGDMRARAADANILPLVFPEIDHAAGLLTANANDQRHAGAAGDQRPHRAGERRVRFVSRQPRDARARPRRGPREQRAATSAARGGPATDSSKLGGRFDVARRRIARQAAPARPEPAGRGSAGVSRRRIARSALPDRWQAHRRRRGDVKIPSARMQPARAERRGARRRTMRATSASIRPSAQGRFVVHSEVRDRHGRRRARRRIRSAGPHRRRRRHDDAIPAKRRSVAASSASTEGRYEAYGQKLEINARPICCSTPRRSTIRASTSKRAARSKPSPSD